MGQDKDGTIDEVFSKQVPVHRTTSNASTFCPSDDEAGHALSTSMSIIGSEAPDAASAGLGNISSDEMWEWHTGVDGSDESEDALDGEPPDAASAGLDNISSDEMWEWHTGVDGS